nr:MAG TPA: hypothetical protein [Caudoviricetes sp.]
MLRYLTGKKLTQSGWMSRLTATNGRKEIL